MAEGVSLPTLSNITNNTVTIQAWFGTLAKTCVRLSAVMTLC